MTKNLIPGIEYAKFKKLIRIMKISFIFLIVGFQLVYAENSYSQKTRLSLDVNNMTLRQVFDKIERSSEYVFLYRASAVNENKVVNYYRFKDQPLNEILDRLFEGTGYVYTIDDRQVYINLKESEKTNLAPEQDKLRISGTILDSKGSPLIGASVMEKGTMNGTVTDIDGRFSIAVTNEKSVLKISYVGYVTREFTVGRNTNPKITLIESDTSFDEVVVVAYGVQKKETLTGAISSVNTKDLKTSTSASLANALAGRISGLTSMQSGGGQPGRDDATMYLRGIGTINGASPLILIDGVPRDNIRTIDINEVESISVLKDASATAVFGVRGANGVILITTRRGKAGPPELTVNATTSISAFTREPSRIHSVDYLLLRNEALRNDGMDNAVFSDEIIAKFQNPLAGLDPSDPDYAEKAALMQYIYPDNDYYRMMIRRWTPQTTINSNLSGGTDKITYFMNVGYLYQGGQLKTEPKSVLGYDPSAKLNRYSFRSNVDYFASKALKVYLNLGTYIEKVNMPNPSHPGLYGGDQNWMMRDLIYQAQTILPISPGPTTIAGYGVEPNKPLDPSFVGTTHYMDRSPWLIMNKIGYMNQTRSNLNSSLGFDLDMSAITKGLSFKGMMSFDNWASSSIYADYSSDIYVAIVDPVNDTLTYGVNTADSGGSTNRISIGSPSISNKYTVNAQASLNYNRRFSAHNVGGMFLVQRDYWETTSAEIPYNVLGIAARATYDYNSRYLAEVNIGYNGSEQFSPSKRFGFFPSLSLGWVASEENFLKDNPTITFLKIRGSSGKVGNDKGQGRFLYQDNIQMGGGFTSSLGKGMGVSEGLLGNPDITWEVAEKSNIGFDITLIKDLSLTFDLFKEHRTQILLTRQSVPIFQGLPSGSIPKVNMGVMDNKGYEIELKYNKAIGKDWLLGFSGNFSYNHNIRQNVDEVPRDETYAYRNRSNGWPVGQTFGYLIDWDQDGGYWTPETIADPNRVTYSFGTPKAGDFVYKDLTGDGIIDEKDEAPIGYGSIPRISWGASFSASYKGFDAYIFFQGLGKYSGYFSEQGTWEYTIRGTYFDYTRTAWTEERWLNGDKITYPRLSTAQNTNHRVNSFFVMNRSFARLKNAELGYTLPDNSLKALGISKMRVFLQGQNIFTWSPKFRLTHLDPETTDPIGYTQLKMFSFGANITF
jgi:TonB-linked SusC/RagA family outer membrane protein